MDESKFKTFASCVINNVDTIAQQAIAFLYFRTRFCGGKVTLQDLISDFEVAGLGRPLQFRLRGILIRDKRTKRIAKDTWMIPSNRFTDVEAELHLLDCLGSFESGRVQIFPQRKRGNGLFIDSQRIKELKANISKKYDLSRLVRMCEEINNNFSKKNYISVIVLVRTILNHVAPIFGFKSFAEVSNNYKCERSLKDIFQHLENSSRKIADGYLHIPVRDKEILPTPTQVNFSQDMDSLLGEVVRILK